ncbi:hypothetical protein ACIO14_30230 [Nocardia fluminea]|uniref:hypothetical protein n=1 Tax=Nocardia fluminea TaxID=134984 RepID=UPI003813891D
MSGALSLLDLSPISEGSSAAPALGDTVDLARQAEQWGIADSGRPSAISCR